MSRTPPHDRASRPAPVLTHRDGAFLRGGRPHRVLAGSLHYFRVHPEQWADRLRRVAAMGLNTVDTYVPWNFHEPRPGRYRFTGGHDVEAFLRLAQETGLDAIVRPGPYICAEWDNGGLPVWLTGRPGMRVRCSHPPYLEEVARWFDELVPRIAALQAGRGGPVVAVQIENEYGSHGDDREYVRRVRDALVERGIGELLYTADGPTAPMQDGGSLPGHLAAVTFGSRAREAAALLRSRRPDEPLLCAEFWNGWFDHWGEKHHVRSTDSALRTFSDILDSGGSVSLYMAHGGTNFGLWAGANHDGTAVQPTVTSYDSDAPIAEHGALTPKFHAFRDHILQATGAAPRPLPPDPALLPPRTLTAVPGAGLLEALSAASEPVASPCPLSFEELDQASGLLLYRAEPLLPPGTHPLTVHGLHDRAQVFADGAPVGVLDRETASLDITGTGRRVRLDLLVENLGRVNYGPLLGGRKGILGGVTVGRRQVHGWRTHRLPLDEWTGDDLARAVTSAAPSGTAGFATARFTAGERADGFLALPGFGKGFVWVNGALLGRYWEIGPQVTLYLPAPLVRAGENTVTVLELHRLGDRIELRDRPRLGPPEEYVETF
ncbi:glycoside hydrolase family 35 protein [Streptomyces thermolilacinus]|uniref:Beta-galactosidase n=1 Tax=Streptomyces thermolilacinus SPC6 TaxID=1306406 RepID=A0A1D3DMW8_9ACTN|nr:glycoside hydrolase family 35 protein [Streptomyces thermolilacinus]OEJ93659.1 beta-galactosidase [Streptomyces thermolilacinus SPC6]